MSAEARMTKSDQEVKYLLFDVESVADGDLIARTRYPGSGLSPAASVRRFRQELVLSSGRDFIPYTYQFPVAIVIAKLREDLSLVEIVSLDQPQHRPHVMTRHFWTGWEKYNHPTWVTFNGRTFDIPLMEHAAFRYGVPIPQWFNIGAKAYDQNRNRYNMKSHLDIQEILTNYGSTWYRGGLNLAAAMLGKPGKMDVQGDMVYDYYCQGRIAEINEYCRCDVLDTYFVLLRTWVLTGRLSLQQEHEHVAAVRQLLESQADEHPAYQQYLSQWGEWENPWDNPVTTS
ncbi:MAG: 3'-5' exonuclease [Pirellulaceae bacterium]|nr:3'-5' exonuclease [Pirellulaceae bacterium]